MAVATATGAGLGGLSSLGLMVIDGADPAIVGLVTASAALLGALGGILGSLVAVVLGRGAFDYTFYVVSSLAGSIAVYLAIFARQASHPPVLLFGPPAVVIAFAMLFSNPAPRSRFTVATLSRTWRVLGWSYLASAVASGLAVLVAVVHVAGVYSTESESFSGLPSELRDDVIGLGWLLMAIALTLPLLAWALLSRDDSKRWRACAIAATSFGGVSVQVGWLAAQITEGIALSLQVEPPRVPLIFMAELLAWASLSGGVAMLCGLERSRALRSVEKTARET